MEMIVWANKTVTVLYLHQDKGTACNDSFRVFDWGDYFTR